MKLLLVDDEGTVHDEIEDIENYDLDKPLARASLVEEIASALKALALRRDLQRRETCTRGTRPR